ncbi:glycoside hydrolase family 3 C-terminal domain-containing protein [Carboxylicivirga linearis]|uniref:Glycoside hydrolase family 3 C-terminal domain-containing protein n=1 Tax=Carboxylicivirga linearis TaxID=1628157 RepID=A0ABS5JY02_9BACT|nr:glycoside hydrolase family 3 C-terminal domain-containing protein [Carboxylicivirga linearis]MBS2099794.1 glycoside hydrolase family 3 C-terminal domain-containing protein [Carboxylicivirga linearis]
MKQPILILLFLILPIRMFSQSYPFQNPKLEAEKRIDNLLSLMTLEEKIVCLSTNPSVPRLGLEATSHVEGLHGLAMGEPGGWGKDNPVPTTTFPQSYGMGQTWDTTLMRQMGEIEGYEVRYMAQSPKYKRGGLVVRAPNADLGRDPRWGRTEECYGEDPFLVGTMSVAFIKGLQGPDENHWQVASLMKHFLANSNEDSRTWSTSNFNERQLREYYALPFQMGVEDGGSRAYMAAYNKVNEVPMMVSPLLKELTVDEWGQNGIICTDGGALKLLISDHKYYDSIEMGASMAVKFGINQFLDDYKGAITQGVENGFVSEDEIDEVLSGVFRVMIKLGLLDDQTNNPYASIGGNDETEPWLNEESKKIVREATQKSIVLLKNKNSTLPINKKKINKLAVIGQLADQVLLDWYSGSDPYVVTPLQGLQERFGKNMEITYVPDSLFSDALTAAKEADMVLVFGGNHPTGDAGWAKVTRDSYGKESVDRKSINLEDEEWIKKIYEQNQNTTLVLVSSFPYAINWSNHNLPAIVHITHNSQEMGHGLADVLSGDYNPAGRLVQTWPMNIGQLPDLLDYNIWNNRTYMYSTEPPLYAFGYGLSYTQFEYQNLDVKKDDDQLLVSLDVANIGKVDGDEVVQVYVSFPDSKVIRPIKTLKGFQRVEIKKGKTERIEIPVKFKDLCYWDEVAKQMVLEKGTITVLVGSSSDNIRLKKNIEIN